jgi:hypothetical protein
VTDEEMDARKRETQIRLELRPKRSNSTSPYRGVYLSDRGWMMHMKRRNYKLVYGPFETEINAAIAFNRKEVSIVGTPAVLNDIPNRCYRVMGREIKRG